MIKLLLLFYILYTQALGEVNIVDTKEKECKNGNYRSCEKAGHFYYFGDYTERNYFKAFELYKKSCDHDMPEACNNLGNLYKLGRGVKQNKKLALKYYGKSCDLKEEVGCQSYSLLLDEKK